MEDSWILYLFLHLLLLFWLKCKKKICPRADMYLEKGGPNRLPEKGVRALESVDHTLKTATLDFCFHSQKRLGDWVGILIKFFLLLFLLICILLLF